MEELGEALGLALEGLDEDLGALWLLPPDHEAELVP